MIHFLTKKELFDALDNEAICTCLDEHLKSDLKYLQDACVLAKMPSNLSELKICEIGGGNSRILPYMKKHGAECWNIEPFEGAGGGPKQALNLEGINNAYAYVGKYDPSLKDCYFDISCSISVVEHIADADMPDFFKDIYRITVPGGVSWHAIDVYLYDEVDACAMKRMLLYVYSALNAGFKLIQMEHICAFSLRCVI